MRKWKMGLGLLLASSAVAAVQENPAATELGTVRHYKEVIERKASNWESKITQLREKAEASGSAKEKRLKTAVRDLESHLDRVRDELKRMSESETPVVNQAAEASIDRHMREMEKLFTTSRLPGAGQTMAR